MTDTTFEEAARCPRCNEPGEVAEKEDHALARASKVTRGAILKVIYCRNSRCRWFNTPWTVQTNPDGTVPPPVTDRRKQFTALDPYVGRRFEENLQRQLAAETQPGAEFYRR